MSIREQLRSMPIIGPVGRAAKRLAYTARRRTTHHNALAGRLMEWRGNRATVGRAPAVTVDLDHPAISRKIKGRFLFGLYERESLDLIARHLDPGLPTVEVGACLGVTSCLTNRLLTYPEEHVVIEANPHLISAIERNRALNAGTFEIRNAALAYAAETVSFNIDPSLCLAGSVHHLRDGGQIVTVPATSLRAILDEQGWTKGATQINLVVDIEGGEIALVEHELDTLRQHVAVLIVELHPNEEWGAGAKRTEAMHQALEKAGFVLVAREGSDCAYINRPAEQGG